LLSLILPRRTADPTPPSLPPSSLFFSTAPAPTQLYTLSLHDALPISSTSLGPISTPNTLPSAPARSGRAETVRRATAANQFRRVSDLFGASNVLMRSEEHTSEIQSRFDLDCRLLLINNNIIIEHTYTMSSFTSRL